MPAVRIKPSCHAFEACEHFEGHEPYLGGLRMGLGGAPGRGLFLMAKKAAARRRIQEEHLFAPDPQLQPERLAAEDERSVHGLHHRLRFVCAFDQPVPLQSHTQVLSGRVVLPVLAYTKAFIERMLRPRASVVALN